MHTCTRTRTPTFIHPHKHTRACMHVYILAYSDRTRCSHETSMRESERKSEGARERECKSEIKCAINGVYASRIANPRTIPIPNSSPPGWEMKYDPSSGKPFYVNHATKATQWEPPANTALSTGKRMTPEEMLLAGWETKYADLCLCMYVLCMYVCMYVCIYVCITYMLRPN
jgi:hypothetical protein